MRIALKLKKISKIKCLIFVNSSRKRQMNKALMKILSTTNKKKSMSSNGTLKLFLAPTQTQITTQV